MKRQTDKPPLTTQPIVGSVFEFWYPACNRVGIPLEWVKEQMLVTEIARVNYVNVDEFLKNPFLRRGPTVIRGIDLSLESKREIMLEAAVLDWIAPHQPKLQLALIDPSEPHDSLEPIGKKYAQKIRECRRLVEMARRFEVPDGLKLVVQTV